MTDATQLKERIRRQAFELGFEACRFTSAAPPATSAHFQNWLAAGKHGGMEYLNRNAYKRVDPAKVLPGATSLICLAASYYFKCPEPADLSSTQSSVPSGAVARYARYADYHDLLAPKLNALTEFTLSASVQPEAKALWYVDTGPWLERDLAQRAGIGFVGKHTNLISRKLGNWFFLAEIVTTLPFEPDPPEVNRCGACVRCLTACPTQAITAPFQLDARRCISYLTIELKGAIPPELRPLIGNRIYGCDDCLQVCPWNRFAVEGKIMKEGRREDLDAPRLVELLALDDAAFKKKFAGTPILRTKRRGLLRNVCVALGNVGATDDLPALTKAASDPEPLIAEHARWAIEQIQRRQSSITADCQSGAGLADAL